MRGVDSRPLDTRPEEERVMARIEVDPQQEHPTPERLRHWSDVIARLATVIGEEWDQECRRQLLTAAIGVAVVAERLQQEQWDTEECEMVLKALTNYGTRQEKNRAQLIRTRGVGANLKGVDRRIEAIDRVYERVGRVYDRLTGKTDGGNDGTG